MERILLDTGPLVTFLAAGTEHHRWVVAQWKRVTSPFLTCEPVLTEAAFLLKREGLDTDPLFELMERGIVELAIAVDSERPALRALIRRYRNRPMSLADACLVRLAEVYSASRVFTFDSDFRIYRRNGNRVVPVLMPD